MSAPTTPRRGPAHRDAGDAAPPTTLRHLLLVGAEPLRRHLHHRGPDETLIDCRDDDPATLVGNAGLFGDQVRVTGAETLDDAAVDRLVDALASSSLSVTIEADKLSARNERRLATVCTVHKPDLRGVNARKTLLEIAERVGVTVDETTSDALLGRLGDNPGRLVGTLELLRAGGYTTPTVKQIDVLAGSHRRETMAWTLLDQIEDGRHDVTGTVERLEAIPTLAFLTRRIQLAAMSVETPQATRDELDTLTGPISDSAWRQVTGMGRRLGPTRCRHLIETLTRCEHLARRGKGPEALALAAGHLHRHLHPGGEPSRSPTQRSR